MTSKQFDLLDHLDNLDKQKQQVSELSQNPQMGVDLLSDSSIPQESYTQSLYRAPGKIVSDVGTSIYNIIEKFPEIAQEAGQTAQELPSLVASHPLHALGQGAAGLASAGRKLLNIPNDLVNYIGEDLNLYPHDESREAVKRGLSGFFPRMGDVISEEDINKVFGEPKYKGEKGLRTGAENIFNIYGGTKAATLPFKLTNRALVNDVLKTKNINLNKYENKLYPQLFEKAEAAGAKPQFNINPNKIDFSSINKGQPRERFESLAKIANKSPDLSLNDYQNAIRDLGRMERELKDTKQKRGFLEDYQARQYDAIKDAKKYIQDNMFKNEESEILSKYLKQHKKIQKGYAKEVVPYTEIPALNEYERGELKAHEVIPSLSKGKFAATRGPYHLIDFKNNLKKLGAGALGAELLHRMYKLYSGG